MTQKGKEIKMSKAEELTAFLRNELDNIYCYNCKNEDTENNGDGEHPCDWCHRKYMGWQASDGVINRVIEIATRREE